MRSKTLFWILFIAYLSDLLIIIKTPAQTNPCPEISSPTITSPQNLSLFDTPNGDRRVVYLTTPNETLALLSPNGLWVNGTCWYRVQSPEGVPYPDLWLATQPKIPSASPLVTPSPQQRSPRFQPSSVPLRPQTDPKNVTNAFNLSLLTPTLFLFFTLGSLIGIITFFAYLSLSAQHKKLTAQHQKTVRILQDNIAIVQKQAKRIELLSRKIINLEKQLLTKPKKPPVDPLAIDLEITNLLRKKGPMSLSSLTALSPHDPDLLQQRLDLLQQESLVKKQTLNDTEIYSPFTLTPAEQQLVTLILVFNQQHLTYFQEQRSQPLNLRENTSPRQLQKATELTTAHYLKFTIEAEHWLIPNILSPEIP
ncbi:MAG: hypothetical protein ACKO5Q_07490, partial [Microcystaceae cyanobacterium]